MQLDSSDGGSTFLVLPCLISGEIRTIALASTDRATLSTESKALIAVAALGGIPLVAVALGYSVTKVKTRLQQ